MPGETRRQAIYDLLCQANTPISGTTLAKQFHVSRQVIVQDIALLRAKYDGIESTYKGYVMSQSCLKRTYYVCHDPFMTMEELNRIVDLGGCIENVAVEHLTYGSIEVKLSLKSRKDVQDFLSHMQENDCKLLTDLTQGRHSHLVSASCVDVLDAIEASLKNMNILERAE